MFIGGFLIQFDSEYGDLELMALDNSTDISIVEYSKGSIVNLECGGSAMGYCDHQLGVCICADGYGSSNSSNAPGSRGDCGYRLSQPLSVTEVNYDGPS
jgi:hypothetical protein